MEGFEHAAQNADELSRRLAARRHELAAGSDAREVSHAAAAVAAFDSYVSLLEMAAPIELASVRASPRTMMLKLEFSDGRWDVAEGELDELPRVGDTLLLADGRMSRVREIQTVLSGRSCKPPRDVVVCTLVA